MKSQRVKGSQLRCRLDAALDPPDEFRPIFK
jgi:hypothetical protein